MKVILLAALIGAFAGVAQAEGPDQQGAMDINTLALVNRLLICPELQKLSGARLAQVTVSGNAFDEYDTYDFVNGAQPAGTIVVHSQASMMPGQPSSLSCQLK